MIPTSKATIELGKLIKVPSIAIGTWAWGNGRVWNNQSAEAEQKVEEAFETLLDSCESVFLDTAELYENGESERIIGRLLNKFKEHKNINKVIIATKFTPYPWRLTVHSLVSALKASLERIGKHKVDLYQIHGPIHIRSVEAVAEGLVEVVKQGLATTVGVSNYSLDQTRRMYEALKKHDIHLASNQVEYSLLRKYSETSGLLKFCKEKDIAILSYSPLGMGRLTGKYSVDNPPPSNRQFGNFPMEQIQPLLDAMKIIADKHNTTISSVALNYTMYKGTIPLAGVKNKEQVLANLKALDWILTQEEVDELEKFAFEGTTNFFQHG